MHKLALALMLAAAPLVIMPMVGVASAQAATGSALGDLTALSSIVGDTLSLAKKGDLVGAEKRITDFETAWDQAAGTMQPLNPTSWRFIDQAADKAIEALRAGQPVQADVETNLGALLTALSAPAAATATPAAAVAAASSFTITGADGSPLPCEVVLKALRDASAGKTPFDHAQYDALQNKGIERCNADDDKRSGGFFAQAFALLK